MFAPLRTDRALGADGVIRNLLDNGELQTLRPRDGAEARDIIADTIKRLPPTAANLAKVRER